MHAFKQYQSQRQTTNNQENTTMSTGKIPTTPIGNVGNSRPPRTFVDTATTPSSNHYPDCPGCLAKAEAAVNQHPQSTLEACPGCPDCLPGLPAFPPFCRNQDRRPRLPPFPLVCGDPTCFECNRSAVSGCQCPSCLDLIQPLGMGFGGQQQSMAERDRIFAANAHFMAEEERRKVGCRIARGRTTRPKSAALMALEKAMDEGEHFHNAMTRLGLYPPSDPYHNTNQERKTNTTVQAHLNATFDAERNVDRMVMKAGETRFGTAGSLCACGDPTCPGMGAGPVLQSIANTRRFEGLAATRGLPSGMLPSGFCPPSMGEVRGPTNMWPGLMFAPPSGLTVPMSPLGLSRPNNMLPGHMFAPPSVPMVPMPQPGPPAPNNMWSGRMCAPTSTPMVTMPPPNTPGPNNLWLDRMFTPRSGPIPEQRQPEIDMQRDDVALSDTRRDHERADEHLTYLQRERAKEEQQVTTLRTETQRMMDEGLGNEEKMVKLARKFFLQLDAEDQVKVTKQELAAARSHLGAAEMACEEAGHEQSSFERHYNVGRHGGGSDSEGRAKEVARDDVRQHPEEQESATAPRGSVHNGSPSPVWSEENRICRDCGGLQEDGENDEDAEGKDGEAHTTV